MKAVEGTNSPEALTPMYESLNIGTSMRDRALALKVDSIVRSESARESASWACISVMIQISPVRSRRVRMEDGRSATRSVSWDRLGSGADDGKEEEDDKEDDEIEEEGVEVKRDDLTAVSYECLSC